jgi:signal peptidase II
MLNPSWGFEDVDYTAILDGRPSGLDGALLTAFSQRGISVTHVSDADAHRPPGQLRQRALIAVFLLVTAIGFVSDQFGKGWAFAPWREGAAPRELIPGLLAGFQARNYGGIHSLEGFGTIVIRGTLTLIGFIAVGMVLRWAIFLDRDRWRVIDAAAGGLLLGGALGNQFDRLTLGYVRDYLVVAARPFEVFNTGDVFMVLGALLLLGSLVMRRQQAAGRISGRLVPEQGN